MSMHEYQLQILKILSQNLQNLQPQLVPTATIAEAISLNLTKLHLVLNTMHAIGLIQTNSDLQFNLITRKGLSFLGEHQVHVTGHS